MLIHSCFSIAENNMVSIIVATTTVSNIMKRDKNCVVECVVSMNLCICRFSIIMAGCILSTTTLE